MSLYDDLPSPHNDTKPGEEDAPRGGGWTNISSVAVKEAEKRIAASVTSLAPTHLTSAAKKHPINVHMTPSTLRPTQVKRKEPELGTSSPTVAVPTPADRNEPSSREETYEVPFTQLSSRLYRRLDDRFLYRRGLTILLGMVIL
jgi:hypothetical protein